MLRSGGGLRARERQQPPRPRARQPQAKVVAPARQHRQRDGALRACRHGRQRVPHAVGVILHRRRDTCARVRLQPQLHAQQALAVRAAADEIARLQHALQLRRAARAEAPDAARILRVERAVVPGEPGCVKCVLAAPQAAARVVYEQVPGVLRIVRREIPARTVRARRAGRERAPERVADAHRPSAGGARRPGGGEVVERLRRRHERAAGVFLRAECRRGDELEVVRLRAVEPPEPVRLEKHHAAARRRAAGKVARRADVYAPCRRGDRAVFVRLVPVPAQRVAELRAPDGVLRAGPDAVGVCACVQRHGHAPRDRDVLDRSDGRERVGVEHEHRARDGADDVGAVVLQV